MPSFTLDPSIACPVIHHDPLAMKYMAEIEHTGELKGAFNPHPDLTIVTAYNYAETSLLERNLSHLGLRECCDVIRLPESTTWLHTFKIELVLDYLRAGRCNTELLIWCDASDVVLRQGPEEIVRVFREYDCDLLTNSTTSLGGYFCMPDVKAWADGIYHGRYLNAGVYIGRPDFIMEVLTEATQYVVENPLTTAEYRALGRGSRDNRLCDRLPDFPRGIHCDQIIMRYIQPRFHPWLRPALLPRRRPQLPRAGLTRLLPVAASSPWVDHPAAGSYYLQRRYSSARMARNRKKALTLKKYTMCLVSMTPRSKSSK